jgi:hypothetical protein
MPKGRNCIFGVRESSVHSRLASYMVSDLVRDKLGIRRYGFVDLLLGYCCCCCNGLAGSKSLGFVRRFSLSGQGGGGAMGYFTTFSSVDSPHMRRSTDIRIAAMGNTIEMRDVSSRSPRVSFRGTTSYLVHEHQPSISLWTFVFARAQVIDISLSTKQRQIRIQIPFGLGIP